MAVSLDDLEGMDDAVDLGDEDKPKRGTKRKRSTKKAGGKKTTTRTRKAPVKKTGEKPKTRRTRKVKTETEPKKKTARKSTKKAPASKPKPKTTTKRKTRAAVKKQATKKAAPKKTTTKKATKPRSGRRGVFAGPKEKDGRVIRWAPPEDKYTLQDVAEAADCSLHWARQHVRKDSKLKLHKSGRWLFSKAQYTKLVRELS